MFYVSFRLEVKLRRKIVNTKRRNRAIAQAKDDAQKQTNFFGSSEPIQRYKVPKHMIRPPGQEKN